MATVFGQPGGGAAKRGLLLLIAWPAMAVVIALLAGGITAWAIGRQGLLVALPGLAIGTWLIWRDRHEYREMLSVTSEGRQWLKGAEGEYYTHKALASLPPEFAVFHDYQLTIKGERQRWNIDHLVVGPTGVFVVETKHYSRKRITASDRWNRRNVKQVQRNAIDVRDQLVSWSNGQLAEVFVVPVLVYVQEGAYVERTREGAVRVIKLAWLEKEILQHSDQNIDVERAGRVVRVLYSEMGAQMRVAFQPELEAYGALSKQARYDKRDAAVLAAAEAAVLVDSPSAAQDQGLRTLEQTAPPTLCPLCGARLIERTAKKGPRAGKRFLGCSEWSATGGCAFKHNLD